jgi:hypothetical protein
VSRVETADGSGLSAAGPSATAGRVLDLSGVVVVCAAAALSGLLEVMLVPLYAGRVLVPVAVVLAVAGNLVLPRLARSLVNSTWAAAAPVAVWLVVTVALGFSARPEGDVLLPGGGYVQWVGFGVFLGGLAAGLAAVIVGMPPPQARPGRIRP